MKIEIEMEGQGGDPEIAKYIAMEKKEHPWMTEAELMDIVKDHLKEDPDFYKYEQEEDEEDEKEEEGNPAKGTDTGNPFAELG